ncbi:cyclin-dependent kinase 1-like [Anopheles ziemanni]|uniref:cyclin-dependent kinase 1-like n=1 Tax=Anopheles coustani TaxID=139045 RepID=UPI002657AE10|nr:cyclin-dependent kinase 1-like [Anopheles coustani]XP_058171007.1 cyclin-dependent kinase 1-like [Anopheles ziemanni]
MDNFQMIKMVGEGSYGIVYKGRKNTGQIVAIKKIRGAIDGEGIPSTALREISILRELKHPNVVSLEDVVMDESRLFLIFEFLSMDLRTYIDSLPLGKMCDPALVKNYLYQISSAILFCHQRRVLHRDLKPRNLLVNMAGVIKIADFGLARTLVVPVRNYTREIVTLWYRAPEVLLGSYFYSCAVDIWSIGCIFAEMVTRNVLIKGGSEIDQLFRMFRVLGTPTEEIWPGVSSLPNYRSSFPCWTKYNLHMHVPNLDSVGYDLLQKCLEFDPTQRISAKKILQHDYFDGFQHGNLTTD